MLKRTQNTRIILHFILSVVAAFIIGCISSNLLKNSLDHAKEEKIQSLAEIVLLSATQIESQVRESNMDQSDLQARLSNLLNSLPIEDNISIWVTNKNATFVIVQLKEQNHDILGQTNKKGDFVIKRAIQKLQSQNTYSFKYTKSPDSYENKYKAIDKISYIKNFPESELIIGCETSAEDIKQSLRSFIFKFSTCMIIFICLQTFLLYYYLSRQKLSNDYELKSNLLLKSLTSNINDTILKLRKNTEISSYLDDFSLLKKNLEEVIQGLKLLAVNNSIKSSLQDAQAENIKYDIKMSIKYLKESIELSAKIEKNDIFSISMKELESLARKVNSLLAK